MINLETLPKFSQTSAAGAMRMGPGSEPLVVGFILAGLVTSTQGEFPTTAMWPAHKVEQTTAGASALMATPSGAHIAELRRLSGLTWEQLARVFKASRRSLHFWASGRAMTPSNEEHLQRLLAVMRAIDRGSASANRAALLVAQEGTIPFDLLAAASYDRVVTLLGPGEARRMRRPKQSRDALTARAPQPPGELVDALQGRVDHERGHTRAAKSVKVRSGR